MYFTSFFACARGRSESGGKNTHWQRSGRRGTLGHSKYYVQLAWQTTLLPARGSHVAPCTTNGSMLPTSLIPRCLPSPQNPGEPQPRDFDLSVSCQSSRLLSSLVRPSSQLPTQTWTWHSHSHLESPIATCPSLNVVHDTAL